MSAGGAMMGSFGRRSRRILCPTSSMNRVFGICSTSVVVLWVLVVAISNCVTQSVPTV